MHRPLCLATLLLATVAFATPPASEGDARKRAEALVERNLLQPLAAKEKERSRFSRVERPARVRRARVVDPEPRKDRAGATFMAFTVEAKHGLGDARWSEDPLEGCVYLESGKVFVRRVDGHLPAEALLGKRMPPAAEHVCQAEAASAARR